MVLIEYLMALNALMQLISREEEWSMPTDQEEEFFPPGEGDSCYYYFDDYRGNTACHYTKERLIESLREEGAALDRLQFSRESILSTLNGTVSGGGTAAGVSPGGISLSPVFYSPEEGNFSAAGSDSLTPSANGSLPASGASDSPPYGAGSYSTRQVNTALTDHMALLNRVYTTLSAAGDTTALFSSYQWSSIPAVPMEGLSAHTAPALSVPLYTGYSRNTSLSLCNGYGEGDRIYSYRKDQTKAYTDSRFSSFAEYGEGTGQQLKWADMLSGGALRSVENQALGYRIFEEYNNRYSNLLKENFAAFYNEGLMENTEHISPAGAGRLISSSQSSESRENVINLKVDFTANANISSDYDVERFTGLFADRLREELAGCAEGVHLY